MHPSIPVNGKRHFTLSRNQPMSTVSNPLRITPSSMVLSDAERSQRISNPGFGRFMTDHMVVIPYRNDAWQQGEVKAYEPLSLDPATCSLHYWQAIFECF